MKNISTFLKKLLLLNLLLLQFSINILAYTCSDNINYEKGLDVVLRFMPGLDPCIEFNSEYIYDISFSKDDTVYTYYRDLKEFIINSNDKYCLWGSKNWDEECQDVSMQYAYGDYGRRKEDPKKFMKTLINFIKHIQNNNFDEVYRLTSFSTRFRTDDPENCIITKPEINGKGCNDDEYRVSFNKTDNNYIKSNYCNMQLFKDNLMQIDADHLKFYLSDLTQRGAYTISIPYEYRNTKKIFSVTFDFLKESDDYYKIYDLFIYNSNYFRIY